MPIPVARCPWHAVLACLVIRTTASRANRSARRLLLSGLRSQSSEGSQKESHVFSKRVSSLVATSLLAASGCGVTITPPVDPVAMKGEPVGGTIHTDTFIQGDLIGGYADILFVVDNSGSMADDQVRLSQS